MKKLLFIILLQFIFIKAAYTVEKDALSVVRSKKGGLTEQVVLLKNLKSSDCLDGDYFKIVLEKNDSPICFDHDDQRILLKAVTTYHHLTIARKFFTNNFQNSTINDMGQIVIRIDITSKFHYIGHFGNENLPKEYNNALSIPEGIENPELGIKGWGHEIWFRPSKKVRVPSGFAEAFRRLPSFNRLSPKRLRSLIPRIVTAIAYQFRFNGYSTTGSYSYLFETLRSMAIIETTMWGMKGGIKLIGKKKATIELDSAFIPEIIYHEFAHLALSDDVKLTHSTPVNEGLADYFAAAIANSPKLAKKIKKYSRSSGKNGNNKSFYNIAYEMSQFASVDFVLGVLWKVRKAIPEKADELIYKSTSRLTSDSNIKNDLLKALLDECRITCKNPLTDRYKLLEVFYNKGF